MIGVQLFFSHQPPNRRFYGKMEGLPLWPTYIAEKEGLWAKHIGLKEVLLGTPLGNTLGI